MSGEEWLYFTKSVWTTAYPSELGHERPGNEDHRENAQQGGCDGGNRMQHAPGFGPLEVHGRAIIPCRIQEASSPRLADRRLGLPRPRR